MGTTRYLIKDEQADVNKIIYNIKSDYILKYIFSHINIKRKLNLIIYNKKKQKKVRVDIGIIKKQVENIKQLKRMIKGENIY